MRRMLTGFAAGLALLAAPVAAQDEGPTEEAAAMAALASAFTVEPLTADQQARLPQARAVVARIMPPGTMQEMMGGMFSGLLGPIMEMEQNDPANVISSRFGYDMTASPEDAAEAAALLDPAWGERRRREAEAVPAMLGRMMSAMEPAMRDIMSELYAVHFSEAELSGIDDFFATPIGAAYARKSFSMTSDPRLMGSVMQQLPTIMGSMGDIEAEMTALTADLPPVRTYDDFSDAERARLVELLQTTDEDLRWQLSPDYGGDAYVEAAEAGEYADYGDYGLSPTAPATGGARVSKP